MINNQAQGYHHIHHSGARCRLVRFITSLYHQLAHSLITNLQCPCFLNPFRMCMQIFSSLINDLFESAVEALDCFGCSKLPNFGK
jgi:hypothetical protein